jgi:hypothetical protein
MRRFCRGSDMPFVIGVGVLEFLLLLAVARAEMREARRRITAAPQDYSPGVFWLVTGSFSLALLGFVSLILGGALMLDAQDGSGKAFLILGLCIFSLGCVGIFSWSFIKQHAKSHQAARADLQEARQSFLNVFQARTLTLRDGE